MGPLVRGGGQADRIQHGIHFFQGGFPGLAKKLAEQWLLLQFQSHQYVLTHGQVRKHGIALEHDAPVPVRLPGEGVTVQQKVAPALGFLAQQHLQEGRLATA